MKTVVSLIVLAVAIAVTNGDFYDKRYENFNVKELVENPRLLKSYVLCLLGKGKCTPEGIDFKKLTPEALHSRCEKCTEKQKSLAAAFIKAILEKLPDDWEELLKVYNPKGESIKELHQFIQEYAPDRK